MYAYFTRLLHIRKEMTKFRKRPSDMHSCVPKEEEGVTGADMVGGRTLVSFELSFGLLGRPSYQQRQGRYGQDGGGYSYSFGRSGNHNRGQQQGNRRYQNPRAQAAES